MKRESVRSVASKLTAGFHVPKTANFVKSEGTKILSRCPAVLKLDVLP